MPGLLYIFVLTNFFYQHTLKGTKRLEECDDNPRKILYLTWARWTNWYKPQPFHAIRLVFQWLAILKNLILCELVIALQSLCRDGR